MYNCTKILPYVYNDNLHANNYLQANFLGQIVPFINAVTILHPFDSLGYIYIYLGLN